MVRLCRSCVFQWVVLNEWQQKNSKPTGLRSLTQLGKRYLVQFLVDSKVSIHCCSLHYCIKLVVQVDVVGGKDLIVSSEQGNTWLFAHPCHLGHHEWTVLNTWWATKFIWKNKKIVFFFLFVFLFLIAYCGFQMVNPIVLFLKQY